MVATNNEYQEQAIVAALMDGVVVIDRDGGIRSLNPAAETMFGHPSTEVVGKNVTILLSGSNLGHVDDSLAQAHEIMGQRRDGSTFPMELTLSAIRGGDDPVFVGVFRDITAKKQAEAALQRSEATLRAMVANAVNGIVSIDASGLVVAFNAAAERLFGYAATEMIGNKVNILMPSPFREEHDDYLKDYQQTGTAKVIGIGREVVARKKDGTVFPIDLAVSEFVLDHMPLYVGMITDISQRKALEQSLRTAKMQAETADRFKSEFLATISHEIRTPMHAILGLLHLVMQTRLDDRQLDHLHKIQKASRSLLEIINDILDHSKIEAGKLTLEITHFRLDDVLSAVADVVTVQAGKKGLELLIDRSLDIPNHLVGDPTRLGQILINLTHNAVKFTHAGEVGITLRLLEIKGEKILIGVRVSDTGIGMTAEQCAMVFEKFGQAEVSTTRHYGGSGLGLSICKHLIEMMEGTIDVASQTGRGSLFSFSVWLRLPPAPATPPIPASSHFEGVKALVVDDHERSNAILANILRSLGISVLGSSSGVDALSLLVRETTSSSGHRIGLIFLDQQMPSLSGVETARSILDIGLSPPPLILLLQACGRTEVRMDVDDVMFAGFLHKPFTPSLVVDVLEKLADRDGLLGRHPPSSPDLGPTPRTPGDSVLLVEDAEINQEIVAESLRRIGIFVTLANNGLEAIRLVQDRTFDLILMDIQMPVMDGITATQKIRTLPHGQNLPIIAMTATARDNDRKRCLEAGMNDFIIKPIEPAELITTLNGWLPRRPRHPLNEHNVQPASDHNRFPSVPDLIDLETGLRRTGGNAPLLQKLWRRFFDDHHLGQYRVREALENNDRLAALNHVHILHGTAGAIGATQLQLSAQALESALKGTDSSIPIAALLRRFEKDFSDAMDGLQRYHSRPSGAAPAPSSVGPRPTDHDFLALLRQLVRSVREMDPVAEDEAERLAISLEGRPGHELARRLVQKIGDTRFDEAMTMIRELEKIVSTTS
ncbi:MAG: PAS domain S-box protein [Magnetococcales bacterium]|nr:PAS domain S-box protein [Magnetococcales bacterium]